MNSEMRSNQKHHGRARPIERIEMNVIVSTGLDTQFRLNQAQVARRLNSKPSKVTEILTIILEDNGGYLSGQEIFEKFQDYLMDLKDVNSDEVKEILDILSREKVLKTSVRGAESRYCYQEYKETIR